MQYNRQNRFAFNAPKATQAIQVIKETNITQATQDSEPKQTTQAIKATYLFISEVCQNRKQVLSGIKDRHDENNDGNKIIVHKNFQIIKPKSFPSNSDEQQQHVKRLADLKMNVNMIFITIRYERLDMMNFRLKTLIKYFQPYSENICLIITDFHKSQKKDEDYDTLKRKLANIFGIKFIYAYYDNNLRNFSDKKCKPLSPDAFFETDIFKKSTVQLDGNKMEVYPQIDYQLLEKMKIRFKSVDPRQLQLDKNQQSKINESLAKDNKLKDNDREKNTQKQQILNKYNQIEPKLVQNKQTILQVSGNAISELPLKINQKSYFRQNKR